MSGPSPADASTRLVGEVATVVAGRRRRERPTTRERLRRVRAPADRTGEVLGGTYRIERKIAAGGMGQVYLVRHVRLDQPFAVKFLDRRFGLDRDAYARFRREAEIAASLDHHAIVQVFDFNTDAYGNPYMVMEYVEGQTLDAFLERHGPLDRKTVLAIFEPLCHALDVAHRHGIVHRDLKPSNIIVQRKRRGIAVKLLDFGISKIKKAADEGATRDDVVMGTPNYMSPEQARGKTTKADARTDVFALGAILYEVLSGKKAFADAELPKLLHAIAYEPHPPLERVAPDVPAAVCRVVDRCLAKDPTDRFPSTRILYRALASAYDLEAEEKRVLEGGSDPGRPAWRGRAAGAVAALVAFAAATGGFAAGRWTAGSAVAPEDATTPELGVVPAPVEDAAPGEAERGPAGPILPETLPAQARLLAMPGGTLVAEGRTLRWHPAAGPSTPVRTASSADVTALAEGAAPDEAWVGHADGTVARLHHGRTWRVVAASRPVRSSVARIAPAGAKVAVLAGGEVRLLPAELAGRGERVRLRQRVFEVAGVGGARATLFAVGPGRLHVVDPRAARVLAKVPFDEHVVTLSAAPLANGVARLRAVVRQGRLVLERTYDVHGGGEGGVPSVVFVGARPLSADVP